MKFWMQDNKFIINDDGKFVLCDECPCNNFYIVGYCTKSSFHNVELDISKEYHIGDLNTIYVISDKLVWPTNSFYNDKSQYVLAGPYKGYSLAEADAKNNKNDLLATLNEKCKGNSLTILFNWNGTGYDLDIKVYIDDEIYGYYFICGGEGLYANHFGDDTSSSGYEKISLKRTELLKKYGENPVPIKLMAHWYSGYDSGEVILNINSTKNNYKNTFIVNVAESCPDDSCFYNFGTIQYYPVDDSFKFIG